jgi:hypothetical protein
VTGSNRTEADGFDVLMSMLGTTPNEAIVVNEKPIDSFDLHGFKGRSNGESCRSPKQGKPVLRQDRNIHGSSWRAHEEI